MQAFLDGCKDFWFVFAAAAFVFLAAFILTAIVLGIKLSEAKKQNRVLTQQNDKLNRALTKTKAYPMEKPKELFDDGVEEVRIDTPAPSVQKSPEPSFKRSSSEPFAAAASNSSVYDESETEEIEEKNPSGGSIKYTVKYDRMKSSWVIIKEGNERPTRRVSTKDEAMRIARELSRKYDANLSVHKKDGKFQKQ